MTTTKEEFEDLPPAMTDAQKHDLMGNPFVDLPLDTFQLNTIIKTIPQATIEKHGTLIRRIAKLNALMKLASDNDKIEQPAVEPIALTSDLTREINLAEVADILSTSVKK